MNNPEAEPERNPASSSQAQDVAIGGNFQVDGAGNSVDFSQTTIDQSHAQITHITQVAFDQVKARPLNPRSPYIGLRKFEVRDRDLFFGRDRILVHLQERLQDHFLLVLGASGSGKSSLIRAGLIPQLAQQRGGGFRELICTPDRNPFESFRASLTSAGYRQSETEFLLANQPDSLLKAAQTVKANDDEWLVFIDQFEELFTLCPNGLIRQHFIDGLVNLVAGGLPSVDLVVAMRADFLDRLSAYPDLSGILQRSELITDLGDDELRLAIEQPAARHGVVFEPDLVAEIIQGLKGRNATGEAERISLPLLQYTLKLLWESSGDLGDRILRTSTYRQIGGVRGALQRRVDEIYNGFSVDEQQVAKHIFLQLVDTTTADVGTTAVGKAVSRRATLTEFRDPTEQKVLQQLINASLLVSDRPSPDSSAVVELAHETLIDSWDTLKRWIEESKPLIRLRNQLKDDAMRWHDLHQQNSAQAEAELWQGSKLQWLMAQKQELRDRFGNFCSEETAFVTASEALADRGHRREVQRLRRTIAGVGIALAAVSGLAFLALNQWIRAEQGQIKALTQTTNAEFTANRDTLTPLLTALDAGTRLQRIPAFLRPPELQADVMTALAQGVYWVREKNRLEGHTDGIVAVAFSPDGTTIATGSYDTSIKLWGLEGQPLPVTLSHDIAVLDVAFNPDGQILASADESGIIKLWSNQGDLLTPPIQAHNDYIHSVQFSPQGESLASASQDGTIKLWDVQGNFQQTIPAHSQPVRDLAFSPNGRVLASASADGTIKLWERNGTPKRSPLMGHQGRVMSVQFSPETNPNWLVSGDDQGSIRIWKATGEPVRLLTSDDTSAVRQVAFSADGRTISAARHSGAIEVWDMQGRLLTTLLGHSLPANGVAFGPDSTTLASASNDQRVILWALSTTPRLTVLPSPTEENSPVFGLNFNQQQPQLATTQQDGQAVLWSLEDGQMPQPRLLPDPGKEGWKIQFSFQGDRIVSCDLDGTIRVWTAKGDLIRTISKAHIGGAYAVSFSPQGKYIASGGYDKLVKLWDINGNPLFSLPGHQGFVSSLAFNAQGTHLVSASIDNTARLWDLQTQTQIATLEGHLAPIWSVAFSPDNSLIATASSDKTIGLWDLNGQPIRTLRGHTDTINSVKFSENGQLLYSASNDKSIKVWQANGELVMTLLGHDKAVNALDTKENVLSSGSTDGLTILWRQEPNYLSLDDLIQEGCDWAKDYLDNQANTAKKLCSR
ncbi:WD40 repeat domain-containing protein [Nodosilinea sp. LEGE 06152]|uniref:nSTAND1 domain-containing NTPase n=1 Tax=Nodosilinea sp. LEGE 06152 TaxID=2777966 RepID=UPI00187F1B23|nr:WD40 repeat domain-containing protein [Nodosilinea sp. LEGE 06152]